MLIDGLVLGGLAVYKPLVYKNLDILCSDTMVLLIIVMVLTGRIMQMKYKARQGAFESLRILHKKTFGYYSY